MKHPLLITPALLLCTALLAAQAQTAQTTPITLSSALASALAAGSTVQDAQVGITSAANTLRAVQADPSTLATALLAAEQASALARAQLTAAKLTATQNATVAFIALYQSQELITLNQLQTVIDSKNLQVAQVKLSTRSGTALDVQNAQNTLYSSRQNLTAAQSQLLVNRQKLANVIARPGQYLVVTPPAVPAAPQNTALSSGYAALVKDQQAVDTAALAVKLAVKLADNEFTARVTLEQARTALSNAQSTLASDQKTLLTTLTTAQSTAEASQASYRAALQGEANALAAYTQDTVRLRSGTISGVALLQSQLVLAKAQYARVQALVSAWQALAALGTASGRDVTGFVQE